MTEIGTSPTVLGQTRERNWVSERERESFCPVMLRSDKRKQQREERVNRIFRSHWATEERWRDRALPACNGPEKRDGEKGGRENWNAQFRVTREMK